MVVGSASFSGRNAHRGGLKMAHIVIGMALMLVITMLTQLVFLSRSSRRPPGSPPISSLATRGTTSFRKVFPTRLPEHDDVGSLSLMPTEPPYRVAVIVVYIGSSLPVWFDAFAQTAAISGATFDWLLFVTKIPSRQTPSNVKIIKLSEHALFSQFAKLVRSQTLPPPYEGHNKAGVMQQLLTSKSYLMVEFKPAFGFIFSDFLTSYTHWAYADIDQLLGRMHPLINAELLNNYDIYTSSFGDNFRMYMRGQLTIHRNTHVPTNLFWGCVHFSNFTSLLTNYLASGNRTWHFESAEGCYSKVVADAIVAKQVSVYVGATQATDAFGAPFTDRESILMNNHLFRCYSEPLSRSYTDAEERLL